MLSIASSVSCQIWKHSCKAKVKQKELLGSRTASILSIQSRDELLKHIIKPITSKQRLLPLSSRLFRVPHALL